MGERRSDHRQSTISRLLLKDLHGPQEVRTVSASTRPVGPQSIYQAHPFPDGDPGQGSFGYQSRRLGHLPGSMLRIFHPMHPSYHKFLLCVGTCLPVCGPIIQPLSDSFHLFKLSRSFFLGIQRSGPQGQGLPPHWLILASALVCATLFFPTALRIPIFPFCDITESAFCHPAKLSIFWE